MAGRGYTVTSHFVYDATDAWSDKVHIGDLTKDGIQYAVTLYACKVKEVFYVTEEEHGILPLPKISWTLQRTKYNLLKMISEGMSDIEVLKEELEISRTMTYTHLRDLKDQALIVETSDGYELTLAGKLLLI